MPENTHLIAQLLSASRLLSPHEKSLPALGATAALGFAPYSPILRSWFSVLPADAPTIGGLVYLSVASLAAGMTVNAIRWAILDTIHAKTVLARPAEPRFLETRGTRAGSRTAHRHSLQALPIPRQHADRDRHCVHRLSDVHRIHVGGSAD